MKLSLLPCVYDIISKIESLTNKKVSFIESDKIQTYAGIKLARKNMETHIIVYKREHDELINHLIAHECGHALRMFAVPEDQRLIPCTDDNTKKVAFSEIEKEIVLLSQRLKINALAEILNMWYQGIVRQLTNYPSDIEIEKWLYRDYPDLKQYQRQSIKKQYKDAIKGLSHEIKELTPLKIYDSANIMNYAFFKTLGMMMSEDYVSPFSKHSNYLAKGKALITLYESDIADNYNGDIAVANGWAEYLGLANWFRWTDFENIPDGYNKTI